MVAPRVGQDVGMPTPLRAAGADRALHGAERPARPVLHRPVEGRIVGGVCAGLAQHLGWDLRLTRIGFIVLTLTGGAGIVAYLFLWALTPQSVHGTIEGEDGRVPVDPARPTGPRQGVDAAAADVEGATDSQSRDATRVLLVGGILLVVGLIVAGQNAGLDRLGFLVPLLVVAVGAVIAWSQLDDAQRPSARVLSGHKAFQRRAPRVRRPPRAGRPGGRGHAGGGPWPPSGTSPSPPWPSSPEWC